MLAMRICASALTLSLITAWVPSAFALTDEERAAARAAAGQGADAFDAGKWAEAIDLFSRAEALVHSPAHLLFIARAQLKLGQWVKAYENLNKIKREQLPPNAAPAIKRAVDDASKELAQLEPQLPYVATVIKNPSGEVTVTVDGNKVPPLLVGLMRPIDPGSHQFQASNGAQSSDVVTLEIKPATKQTVELELKAAPVAGPASPTPAAPPPPPAADQPPADAGVSTSSSGMNGKKIGGFVALGVGAVGLGVGTFFLVKSFGTQSDADDLCPGDVCDPSLEPQIDAKDADAASQRTIGVVGLGVGAVGVAAGVTLLVLSGSSEIAQHQRGVTPYVGFNSVGVTGRF
jgi:hypothetical protein